MAGGSLRDKIAAEKKGIGELRKGLDTIVVPVRPPSNAVLSDGGGHAGPSATPVAREPAPVVRAEAPAEAIEPKPARREEPKPALTRPRTAEVDAGDIVEEAPARTPTPAPHVAEPAEGPSTDVLVHDGSRARRIEDAPVDLGSSASAGPLERFGMGGDEFDVPPRSADSEWAPAAPVSHEAPTMVVAPVAPPTNGSYRLDSIPFDTPGTKRKITRGCMLEYVGSKGDEYKFVLTNTHGKKPSRENITLRVGDAPISVGVKTKVGDATLDFSLTLNNKGHKIVTVIMNAPVKTLDKLVKSATHFHTQEFWANLRIKPYKPEIAFTVIFAAIDGALLYTGLGSNLLGALFQPVAVAGLAAVQFGLVFWSGVHRSNNLTKEAKALEVKADPPKPT